MKKIYTLLLLAFITTSIKAQTVEVLTNNDVITLTKTGLPASVIISKIQSSIAKFDVTTEALINLSKNGVDGTVINEMMKTNNQKAAAKATEINSKDPNAMHKSGVYIYDPSNADNPLKRIEAVRTRYQTSSGGYGGYSGTSTSAIISGEESRQKISEQSPVFYFYFSQETKSDDWFASSPNEFALVQVKVIPKKDIRLFKTGGGSSSGFSSSYNEGIPEKLKLPFDFKEVSEGIYKITFKSPLERGEYCFTYADNTSRVFDFGISGR